MVKQACFTRVSREQSLLMEQQGAMNCCSHQPLTPISKQ